MQSLQTNEVLRTLDIGSDTVLRNKMENYSQTIFKTQPIMKNGRLKSIGQNFNVINLATKNNKIYLVIRFRMLSEKERSVKFAIAEYDTLLKFRDVFILPNFTRGSKYYILPPYHEIEFFDSNKVLITDMGAKGLDYMIYKLNRTTHQMQMESPLVNALDFVGPMSLLAGNKTLLYPAIYAVPGSGSNLFYSYPSPFFYYPKTNDFIDPYSIKKKLDQLKLNKNTPLGKATPDLSVDLTLNSAPIESGVVLASYQKDSLVYAIVSTSDSIKTDIMVYSISNKKSKIFKMDIPSNRNFIFYKSDLIYVENTGEYNFVIKRKAISEFSF